MHGDPLAYFLTWVAYGTWLPGDARGWVEYRHGWQLPDPVRELEAKSRMTEDACLLNPSQRRAVERQIAETCAHRGWTLHAVNCRSNHVHVVVTAEDIPPKKIRSDLKAWSTRALKTECDATNPKRKRGNPREHNPKRKRANATRENWWAERGSIRYINRIEDLEAAVLYVQEAQDAPRHQPEA